MTYRGKDVWVEEAERKSRAIANLDEKEREAYLKGYHDSVKFWLGLEEKGYIDVHIGRRSSDLLDDLD